jgi:hypothetical protein
VTMAGPERPPGPGRRGGSTVVVVSEPPPRVIGAERVVYNARDRGVAGDGRTNDQPALAALVDALGAAFAADGLARVIYCPPGIYRIEDAGITWRSGVSLIGAGLRATRFVLSNAGRPDQPTQLAIFTTQYDDASRENHIADVTFADFEIDGSEVRLAEYDVLGKGLGLQYVLRGRFRDLYIHDTAATGLGCDFLQDTTLEGVLAVNCGRLDSGTDIGGAGIGIGIGGWGAVERTIVRGCTAVGNGRNGIFFELQKDSWPPPRGIHVTDCHVEGNLFGISDWGAEGLVVTACTMFGNHEAGFDISSQGTTAVAGRGGILTGCNIDGNVGDGVSIGDTPGPYAITGNRITNNGRYGYRQCDLPGGDDAAAQEVVIANNDFWGNGLDAIRVEFAATDLFLLDNRIRNNGIRTAPRASGAAVSVDELSLTDQDADWPEDGHRGKSVTIGGQTAVVTGNDGTTLRLAPWRPGATSAWRDGPPPAGSGYSAPAAPSLRAGITFDAPTHRATIRGNRVWGSRGAETQTHGLWITASGSCIDARVHHNDLAGNVVAPTRFDTQPVGGHWHDNVGIDLSP